MKKLHLLSFSKFTSCSCISSLDEERLEDRSSWWEMSVFMKNPNNKSVNYWKSLFFETDEMASPLNPEWHSEILIEISVSVEIKVHVFVIGRFVKHDSIWWLDWIYPQLLTPWYDTSLYLALRLCVVISHIIVSVVSSLMYSQVTSIKNGYTTSIYWITLEIHCINHQSKARPYLSLVHS